MEKREEKKELAILLSPLSIMMMYRVHNLNGISWAHRGRDF